MRPLSERGRREADELARKAAGRGAKPQVVYHSGKARARQTAEALWRRCNPLAAFSAVRGLQPSDAPRWIVDTLLQERRDVMLVGHFPHLPRLLSLLLSGDQDAGAGAFPMHGIVTLERVEEKWVERWREGPGP